MNRVVAFLKTKDPYLGLARYILGLAMMPYAISKILKTQFIVWPLTTWQQPLEKLSGTTLTWAFLGYSQWFEVLLGFFELIPAILLLFRRTNLIGAILLLPVSLNVYLINIAFDLWPETQMISLVLLSLNFLILIMEWRKMLEAIQAVFNRIKLRFTLAEIAINLIVIASVLYFSYQPLSEYTSQRNFLTGDWLHRHPNEWILEKEQLGDSVLPKRELKIYFEPFNKYSELEGCDNKAGSPSTYQLNETTHSLDIFFQGGDFKMIRFKNKYKLVGSDTLQLERIFQGKGSILIQTYRKRIINGQTPAS